jgi:hypothetical protein
MRPVDFYINNNKIMNQIKIDKYKLEAFRIDLNTIGRPEVKSIECAVIMSVINGELAKLNQYIKTELNKL